MKHYKIKLCLLKIFISYAQILLFINIYRVVLFLGINLNMGSTADQYKVERGILLYLILKIAGWAYRGNAW